MVFIDNELNEIFVTNKEKRKDLKVRLFKVDKRLRKHPISKGNTRARKRLVKEKVRLETLIKIINQSLLSIIANCLKR
jgi:hypothetical protein